MDTWIGVLWHVGWIAWAFNVGWLVVLNAPRGTPHVERVVLLEIAPLFRGDRDSFARDIAAFVDAARKEAR
jgi:hypothetical protein